MKKNRRLSGQARQVESDGFGVQLYEDPNPERRWFNTPIDAGFRTNDDGTVELSFSSENPVIVWGEPEVLSHDANDAHFERFATVGAILKNHNADNIVGKPEKVWVGDDRKGRAKMRFGTTEKAKEAKQEVDDGSLRGVSVGFIVNQWTYFAEAGDYKGRDYPAGTWLASDWEALEASLTPVPADASVGVGRTNGTKEIEGDKEMKKRKIKLAKDCERGKAGEVIIVELPDDKFRVLVEGEDAIGVEVVTEPAPVPDPDTRDVPPTGAVKRAADGTVPKKPEGVSPEDVQRMIEAERERTKEINAIGKRFGVDVDELVERGGTVEQAKDLALGAAEDRFKNPVEKRVEVTADDRESFNRAAEHSIMLRGGATIPKDMEKAGGEAMGGMSLLELCKECMKRAGMTVPASKHEIVRMGFENGGPISFGVRANEAITVGTSDFPFILANVMNKEMLNGANLSPTTYQDWCKIGSVSDFKQASRLKLSHAGKLELVAEGAGYNMTKFAEQREVFAILTYGKLFNLSRQAIINDDLDAFIGIPRSMGMVASVLPNDLAVIVLLANAAMADAIALFAAAHGNLTASANNALDTIAHARAGIGNLLTKMLQQTAFQNGDVDDDEQLQLRPVGRILLVPPTDHLNAEAVLGATMFGTDADGINPIANKARIVIEPSLEDSNLTGNSTTAYYLFADPNLVPVIEVAFLDGNTTPFMEETVNTGSAPDGRTFKVRMDAVAKSVDWKGAQKEAGA